MASVKVRQGRPQFEDRCVLCMRCIHDCPQEAIQIGRATVDKLRWRAPKGDFELLGFRPEGVVSDLQDGGAGPYHPAQGEARCQRENSSRHARRWSRS